MGAATATITADYGPGETATTKVIQNVQSWSVDLVRRIIAFHTVNSDLSSPQLEFDLNGVTTVTVSVSGQNMTLTIS